MDDGDHPWVMAARPSSKGGLHHPLITRFHPTIGPHDPHLLRWTFPSELSLGVYHGMTIPDLDHLGPIFGSDLHQFASKNLYPFKGSSSFWGCLHLSIQRLRAGQSHSVSILCLDNLAISRSYNCDKIIGTKTLTLWICQFLTNEREVIWTFSQGQSLITNTNLLGQMY